MSVCCLQQSVYSYLRKPSFTSICVVPLRDCSGRSELVYRGTQESCCRTRKQVKLSVMVLVSFIVCEHCTTLFWVFAFMLFLLFINLLVTLLLTTWSEQLTWTTTTTKSYYRYILRYCVFICSYIKKLQTNISNAEHSLYQKQTQIGQMYFRKVMLFLCGLRAFSKLGQTVTAMVDTNQLKWQHCHKLPLCSCVKQIR